MTPQPVAIDHSSKVMKRYTDAYRAAKLIVMTGDVVKFIGFLLLAVAVSIGFIVGDQMNEVSRLALNSGVPMSAVIPMQYYFRTVAFMLPTALGGLVCLATWLLGTFVAAQGQLFKASVDGCVNTSPFLADGQRAQVMSLT